MKGVIRIGDPTSHGGAVIKASSRSEVVGKTVARLGDECFCPIPGHQVCLIAEGDSEVLVDGIPVAFDGCKTTCGATLISTMPTSGRS